MGYITRTTNGGETWADLAALGYGDVNKIPELMADNPHAPCRPVLPGGVVIRYRVVDREEVSTKGANVPPWKR